MSPALGSGTDFYLSTKHYGVHLLYRQGLSPRAIAADRPVRKAVEKLLATYGHIDVIALEEIDALYDSGKVAPLRVVESDALQDAAGGRAAR